MTNERRAKRRERTLQLVDGGSLKVREMGCNPEPGDLYLTGIWISLINATGTKVAGVSMTPSERLWLMHVLSSPMKEEE